MQYRPTVKLQNTSFQLLLEVRTIIGIDLRLVFETLLVLNQYVNTVILYIDVTVSNLVNNCHSSAAAAIDIRPG